MSKRIPHKGVIAVAAMAVALSGCSASGNNSGGFFSRQNKFPFEGQYYRANLSVEKDSKERFVVTVVDAAKGIGGAKEAGRYEATKYCLKNYGSSEVEWTLGPDAEDSQFVLQDGDLSMQGECVGWI